MTFFNAISTLTWCSVAVVVGGTAYVYRHPIIGFVSSYLEKYIGDNSLFVLSSVTSSDNTTGINLYEGSDDAKKEKKYQCEFSSKLYECDVVDEINIDTKKKWITTQEIFKKSINKSIELSKLQADKNLFLLKVNKKMKDVIKWEGEEFINIVQKQQTGDQKKTLAKLKILGGKSNKNILGKINYYLIKIEKPNTTTDLSQNIQCSFDDKTFKNCEINRFSTNQTPSEKDDFSSLVFTGQLKNMSTETDKTLKKHEYYLVKFTDDDVKNIAPSKTICIKINQKDAQSEKIECSNCYSVIVYPDPTQTSDQNLLIFN